MKYTINVTQEDIDKGQRCMSHGCPNALALSRTLGIPCSFGSTKLEITLTTQFPKHKDDLAQLVQQMLGPWCSSVVEIESNVEGSNGS